MLSTFLSLYTIATLTNADIPAAGPHIMPWNETVMLEESTIPKKDEANIAPVISAKGAIAVDLNNGLILYEKNIHEPLSIASLTKLMTTVIIIEENNPDEIVTISNQVSKTEGSKIWLAQGEKITVENLLYASLINSANDAAMALAEHNAGDIETFVNKMNQKALDLGLYSTKFINPTGLDDINYLEPSIPNPTEPSTENIQTTNISSVYDMTLLARYAYGKSIIRRTVSKKELEISSTNEAIVHKLKNTNALLNSYLKVLGLKTGTTDQAGECLIAIVQNDQGNDILTIVLNSPDRYKETKVLADWVFRNYQW